MARRPRPIHPWPLPPAPGRTLRVPRRKREPEKENGIAPPAHRTLSEPNRTVDARDTSTRRLASTRGHVGEPSLALRTSSTSRIAAETLAAHRTAVRAAVGYLESDACWTRRGAGGSTRLVGEGFVAVEYVHRLSRAGRLDAVRQERHGGLRLQPAGTQAIRHRRRAGDPRGHAPGPHGVRLRRRRAREGRRRHPKPRKGVSEGGEAGTPFCVQDAVVAGMGCEQPIETAAPGGGRRTVRRRYRRVGWQASPAPVWAYPWKGGRWRVHAPSSRTRGRNYARRRWGARYGARGARSRRLRHPLRCLDR